MDWEKLCMALQLRVLELEKENSELRSRLGLAEAEHSATVDNQEDVPPTQSSNPDAKVHMRSTPEEKIRLFRSLFHGREDVFARRWYSVQKKKGGYAPVCSNEWKYGV